MESPSQYQNAVLTIVISEQVQADLMEVLTSKTSSDFENLIFTCSTLKFSELVESMKEEGALDK